MRGDRVRFIDRFPSMKISSQEKVILDTLYFEKADWMQPILPKKVYLP